MSKYKQVKINLTEEDHLELSEKAKDKNMTLAQYIRTELDVDLKEKPRTRVKKTDSKDSYKKEDPELLYHLAKIGNNINQIAKAFNSKEQSVLTRVQVSILLDIKRVLNDYLRK